MLKIYYIGINAHVTGVTMSHCDIHTCRNVRIELSEFWILNPQYILHNVESTCVGLIFAHLVGCFGCFVFWAETDAV